jgi:hypothetical protein
MTLPPKKVADQHVRAGNKKSAESPGPARPWTEEEMANAKPLPMPTVDSPKAPVSGVPHAGKGETKPAGKPEEDPGTPP